MKVTAVMGKVSDGLECGRGGASYDHVLQGLLETGRCTGVRFGDGAAKGKSVHPLRPTVRSCELWGI
jgi:hypothetical protein